MNIRPISNISYANKIDFTSRKNKQEKVNHTQNPNSQFAKVPLMVLLAMSPVVTPLSASAQNTDSKIVFDSQIKDMHFVGLSPVETEDGTETIYFQKRSNDFDNSAEVLAFDYFNKITFPDGQKANACMYGIINNISNKTNSDGRYIATYQEIKYGKIQNERICSLPEEFGKYLLKFAKSKENNGAIKVQTRSELEEEYGISNIEGATPIYELCTTVEINGKKVPLYK